MQVFELSHHQIGYYIACKYDYNWYIGLVEEVCEGKGDVRISFMHPKGPGRPENCFYWPTTKDFCYIPGNDILKKITAPVPSSKSGRKYMISSHDVNLISEIFESRIS